MGYLLDALDQKALVNQQDVVRNERRETTENRPYGIVDEAMYTRCSPPGIRIAPTSSARTPTSSRIGERCLRRR